MNVTVGTVSVRLNTVSVAESAKESTHISSRPAALELELAFRPQYQQLT